MSLSIAIVLAMVVLVMSIASIVGLVVDRMLRERTSRLSSTTVTADTCRNQRDAGHHYMWRVTIRLQTASMTKHKLAELAEVQAAVVMRKHQVRTIHSVQEIEAGRCILLGDNNLY